jgi:DNA-binding NtrC family response regulator
MLQGSPTSAGMVLIVSCNRGLRTSCSRIFRQAGYRSSEARTKVQAELALVGGEFDLVVIDQTLAMKDQVALLSSIKGSALRTRVVLLPNNGHRCQADGTADSINALTPLLERIAALFRNINAVGIQAARNRSAQKPN